MYNFSQVESPILLTKDWILKKVDDTTILYYYFGSFKLNKAYCSFFDKNDTRPSTVFYVASSGKIIYYDFRTGEKLDCFGFVKKLYNCSFKEALEQIASDFGLISTQTLKVPQQIFIEARKTDKEVKKETLIQFEPTNWTDDFLYFWKRYEIKQEELVKNKVYPVKRLFLNRQEIKLHTPTYALPEHVEERTYVKIYNPGSSNMKWLSTIPLDIPFGLNDLPYEDNKVIITKSKKDLIVLKKFFTDVIATQNESEASLSETTINKLNQKYTHKIIIWDNDETGVQNSIKLNQKGFDYFNIPKQEYIKHKIKDCSDYVEAYGTDALEVLLKSKNLIP